MADLQATIELSVELNKFYNVDLFQRGYYQVHVILKTAQKSPAHVEVSDNKLNAQKGDSSETAAAFKQGSVGKSQKFQIQYRSEEINVGDIFVFRIQILVDSTKLEKHLENLDLKLEIQLLCNSEDDVTETDGKMELVSTRVLLLHMSPTQGLHQYIPVLFDYFHLSAIEVVIHGTVVALHQPSINLQKSMKTGKNSDQATLEAVYFGQKAAATAAVPPSTSSSVRQQQAQQMHKTICNILLSAHESLQSYLQQFVALIPGNNFQFVDKDCHTRLGETVKKILGMLEEDGLIQAAASDITQFCAENAILWAQFLEVVLRQPKVHLHLAIEHHNHRVRRFAEGFFTMEHNKSSCLSCYDPGVHGHSSLASMVRNSPYFCNLPPLPVECVELDGDENSLPVIFEDIFRDARALPPYVYQKAAQNPMDDNMRSLSREPTTSNPSTPAGPSQNTTPRLTKRFSKKFIKNVKPEEMKWPTSYFCKDADVAHSRAENVAAAPAVVTLISYRKIPSADSVPSVTDVASQAEACSSIHSSLRPTVGSDSVNEKPTACLPSSNDPCLRSSATREQVPCGESNLSSSDASVLMRANITAKTDSATLIQSPRISLKRSPSSGDGVSPKPSNLLAAQDLVSNSSINKSQSSPSLGDYYYSTRWSPPVVQETVVNDTLRLNNEDLCSLVNDISLALGEKGCPPSEVLSANNDEDFSEEDTDVVNGFDEVLSTYKQDFMSTKPSDSRASAMTLDSLAPLSVSADQGSLEDKPRDKLQASDLKSSDSALGSEISSQEEINSSPSPSAGVRLSPTASTTTPASVKLAAAAPPSHGCLSADPDGCLSADPDEKVTVMELLKEEYRKSLVQGPDSVVHAKPATGDLSVIKPPDTNSLTGHRAASDSDIHKNCDEITLRSHRTESQELLQRSEYISCSKLHVDKQEKTSMLTSLYPELSQSVRSRVSRLVTDDGGGPLTSNFIHFKETLKLQMDFSGYFFSDYPTLASSIPYFQVPKNVEELTSGIHLIVCVHGLDGNSADLRLVRTFIEMALPGFRLEFLMSERNQQDTFADFDTMTDKLVEEILSFLDTFGLPITRISFVGHSLGNIIIRSTLSRPTMSHLLPKLYTLLSLSGPHLGTLYNTSGLVNMGMWFMQKWKKSDSLLQLALKDHSDPRQTFLYRLSQMPVLQYFKHVLLVGCHQDRYVPYHSSRIEICRPAQKDTTVIGAVYREMVQNLLEPVIQSPQCTLIRYDVFHALPSTANTMIGRAAHIAVLDSEIFIEKFLVVTGLKYFQ